jgi:hypothetical protein
MSGNHKGGKMKIRRWIVCGMAVFLPMAIGLPAKVDAAENEVSGQATTVIEWFETAEEETALPIFQYLLFNVKNIYGKDLSFKSYGRLGVDVNDRAPADSRLYYAYLEKKNYNGKIDFKLGRQFITTTAGASMMDGLLLKYRNLLPKVNFSLFGGGDVSYYDDYDSDDFIVGGEIEGIFRERLQLGLSYLQKWDDSDLSHELIGLDAEYDFKDTADLYGELQFNYLSDCISYFLGGANYHRNPKWNLRTEYLYSLPVFSSTSIYSVFAADKYEELMAEVSYRHAVGLRSFLSLSHEFYEEVEDANVLEAGIEKIRTDKLSGYASVVLRNDDDGQNLYGVKIHGAYRFHERLQVGVGIHADVLERRLEEDDETSSQRYWADATYYVNKKINIQAKVERIESTLWSAFQGRAKLTMSF